MIIALTSVLFEFVENLSVVKQVLAVFCGHFLTLSKLIEGEFLVLAHLLRVRGGKECQQLLRFCSRGLLRLLSIFCGRAEMFSFNLLH